MPLPLAAVIAINAGSAILGGLLRNLTTPEVKPPPDQSSHIMRSGTVMHTQAAQNMRPVIEQLMLQSSGSNNVAALQTAFRHAGGAADRIDAMIADQLTRASAMRSEQVARANEYNAIQKAQGWQNTIAGLGAATESVLTALDTREVDLNPNINASPAQGVTDWGPDPIQPGGYASDGMNPNDIWSRDLGLSDLKLDALRNIRPINRPTVNFESAYGKGQPFPW